MMGPRIWGLIRGTNVNNPELMVLLAVGACLMCVPIGIQMRWYGVAVWKSVIISLVLVAIGLFGSRFWYFVENGHFRGRSFYGAIFFAPLVYFPVAKLLRIPYGITMDFVAPAGCLTLAMVKIQCLRDGCCAGMVLFTKENLDYVKFPSQIVEMAAFLIISVVLMGIGSREKNKGRVFPWFLVLYGSSRFVLDFLRGSTVPYALGLSAGSFWSVMAFAAGVLWLCVMYKTETGRKKECG